jgi:hypothetical protein
MLKPHVYCSNLYYLGSDVSVPDSLRTAQMVFFTIYVCFRIIHTIICTLMNVSSDDDEVFIDANAIQPWRSITYGVAQICFFALCFCFISGSLISTSAR